MLNFSGMKLSAYIFVETRHMIFKNTRECQNVSLRDVRTSFPGLSPSGALDMNLRAGCWAALKASVVQERIQVHVCVWV